MIEEYCKCNYSISPKVRLRLSFVVGVMNKQKNDIFNELTN